ncbi:MAG: hypothetical protein ACQGVC_25300 [Myxococcota bacterium]
MRVLAIALLPAVALSGCASVEVREDRLPDRVVSQPFRPGAERLFVMEGLPAPMVEELEQFVGGPGRTLRAPTSGRDLGSLCRGDAQVLLHARHDRSAVVTNVPDRNTSIIYFAATVIAIPIALGTAAFWKWYSETVVSGSLDVWDCATGSSNGYVESYRLRSEGRGFVRGAPLEEAQLDGALRGLTRQLLEQAVYDPRREP